MKKNLILLISIISAACLEAQVMAPNIHYYEDRYSFCPDHNDDYSLIQCCDYVGTYVSQVDRTGFPVQELNYEPRIVLEPGCFPFFSIRGGNMFVYKTHHYGYIQWESDYSFCEIWIDEYNEIHETWSVDGLVGLFF